MTQKSHLASSFAHACFTTSPDTLNGQSRLFSRIRRCIWDARHSPHCVVQEQLSSVGTCILVLRRTNSTRTHAQPERKGWILIAPFLRTAPTYFLCPLPQKIPPSALPASDTEKTSLVHNTTPLQRSLDEHGGSAPDMLNHSRERYRMVLQGATEERRLELL